MIKYCVYITSIGMGAQSSRGLSLILKKTIGMIIKYTHWTAAIISHRLNKDTDGDDGDNNDDDSNDIRWSHLFVK